MARRPALPGVDRRQRILEAALDVFAELGFDGATNKDIAARADVTPGLIYFYFPGKEELFFAAFAHQAEQAFARFQLPTGDEPDPRPPAQVIREAVGSLVDALDEPRSLSVYRMIMRATFHSEDREGRGRIVEDARCYMRDLGQRIGTGFRAYLDAEIARGRLRPVNTALAAQIIMHSTIMAAMRRASGDPVLGALSRDELVDNIVGICLHGLLPERATAATEPATPTRRRAARLASLDPPAAPPAEPDAVALN
jgi:AcrR family transcriptional regulator